MAGPIGEPRDKADRPKSPVPSGLRQNAALSFVALLGIVAQATTFVARLA